MYSQTRCRVQVSHWEAAWGGNCLKTSAMCRMETGRRVRQPKKLDRAPVALEGDLAMPSFAVQAASRRRFLQFLAGSPLWAAGALEAFA
jgi:hypothetical protein